MAKATLLEGDRLRAVMMKVRKGATASLSLMHLRSVVVALGGSVEIVSLEIPVGLRLWGMAGKTLVGHVPVLREHGDIRVDGTEETNGTTLWVKGMLRCTGLRLSLGGETTDIRPSEYRVTDYCRCALRGEPGPKAPGAALYDAVKWLTEHGWCDLAAVWLGEEPHRPGVPRTRDGTGTCGACFANVKLGNGLIVLHGYLRPGDGYVIGRCFGVGYKPFELAVDATRNYRDAILVPEIEGHRGRLADLREGRIAVLGTPKDPITPDNPRWKRALEEAIAHQEAVILRLTQTKENYDRLVFYWKTRDLPKEGEYDKGWFVNGQKHTP